MRRRPTVFSEHARDQMVRRGLDDVAVLRVAFMPEQVIRAATGREIRQSRIEAPNGGWMLVRVIVEVERSRDLIVTAYRTSRIAGYRRQS